MYLPSLISIISFSLWDYTYESLKYENVRRRANEEATCLSVCCDFLRETSSLFCSLADGRVPSLPTWAEQLDPQHAELGRTVSTIRFFFLTEQAQEILYGRHSDPVVKRCPHSAACHIRMRFDIGSIDYGCPCNLVAPGPEPCTVTSDNLGVDPEFENTWSKNSGIPQPWKYLYLLAFQGNSHWRDALN